MSTMFVRLKSANFSLNEVATQIFSLLNLSNTEERESSNYIDGYYYLGHASNASVEVCLSDECVMPDFPVWVTIDLPRSWAGSVSNSISTEPKIIAETLAKGGFEVFIPTEKWGLEDWDESGTLYTF